ncbi:hypothetical protein QQ020_28990 [Fulvivirgaceae bacterium BMA12]|uniref:Uncharacterized protein n=1 Tax=Agaribacillus aureus TaxID=3051825 RepID=A0ABT8LIP6_9BACT|nr:hypothetical protein [Fulvivirgaceae bacterium BMA12]
MNAQMVEISSCGTQIGKFSLLNLQVKRYATFLYSEDYGRYFNDADLSQVILKKHNFRQRAVCIKGFKVANNIQILLWRVIRHIVKYLHQKIKLISSHVVDKSRGSGIGNHYSRSIS